MSGMETTQCFICQGDSDPDPYGEIVTLTDSELANLVCNAVRPIIVSMSKRGNFLRVGDRSYTIAESQTEMLWAAILEYELPK